MSDRPAVLGLVPPLVVALAVALVMTACAVSPAEIPDGAVLRPGTSTPRATSSPGAGPELDGDEMTRRITLCLARYGLSGPPAQPAEDAPVEERLVAQRELDEYSRTLTNCSAEAMGTTSPTPAS